ncbi:hypothetical protein BpHYR1_051467 [Brachionus plicatilis]|uniref:NSF AAA+ ATPase lid domain-containing protein n=1 Tax=Brachionus plicatilis TaxID=10195 RepID=A0A3M7SVG9_BRAPC|nr:hypothetical protein BpHYR1_051467 [Brachionus plicatilis]
MVQVWLLVKWYLVMKIVLLLINIIEYDQLSKQLDNKGLSIGIKSLLDVVELSKQATDVYRTAKFVSVLEEIAGLHDC